MKYIGLLLDSCIKFLYGGLFYVKHHGSGKVFWCMTMKDALEWVQCGFNDELCTVCDYNGHLLAVRNPV